MPMIQFRCWYCNKRYTIPEQRIGEQFLCTCKQRLRVPRRSGGGCRVKTIVDWGVEAVVYGGGGALLGLGLALLILGQSRGLIGPRGGWPLLLALPTSGFLLGLFGGERGINWIGQMIRDREKR